MQMHEIQHGKVDRLSLNVKYPSILRRLFERNQSCGLSLNIKDLGVVRRLSRRNQPWYGLSFNVKYPGMVRRLFGCN